MSDELKRDDLDAWEVESLPATFEDRVMDALEAPDPSEAQPRNPAVVWGAVLSFAAAAAVIVALWPRPDAFRDDAISVRAGASARLDYAPGSHEATQSHGTATYRVRRGTPFVVHTPAADVTVRGTEFTVEMLTMQDERRRKYLGLGALAMGGAAVAVYVGSGEVTVHNEHGRVRVGAGQTAVASEHRGPRTEAAPVAAAATAKPKSKSKSKSKSKNSRTLTPTERAGVRRRIEDAIAKRQGGSDAEEVEDGVSPGPETEKDEALGSLQKDYIKSVVSEDLLPLVRECFETALESSQGRLDGSVTIKFSIAGDASVGGIVDEVELDNSEVKREGAGRGARGAFPLAENPEFAECVSESTASLLFDPPEGGGRVQVSYPFIFAAADAAAAAD
ncbi:MAG: hypothetical protein ACRBN8_14930 [Nannocystales bacterium]